MWSRRKWVDFCEVTGRETAVMERDRLRALGERVQVQALSYNPSPHAAKRRAHDKQGKFDLDIGPVQRDLQA